jgi:hypothetical protein
MRPREAEAVRSDYPAQMSNVVHRVEARLLQGRRLIYADITGFIEFLSYIRRAVLIVIPGNIRSLFEFDR